MNKDVVKKQLEIASELYRDKEAYRNDGMKALIDEYKSILEEEVATTEQQNETRVETGSFKGSATMSIVRDYQTKSGETKQDRVFSFGVTKAKLLLKHLEEIKKFVENNEQQN